MEDRHDTAWSVALVVAFTGLALLYCVAVFGPTHRGGGWFQPPDAPILLKAGDRLVHGHLRSVYWTPGLYDLPLSFPIAGVTALLGGWLHLHDTPNPTTDFVLIPIWVTLGVPVLQQVRRLAWDLGMRKALWAVQVAAVFLVLVPEVEWGHVEDVLALACLLAAVRRLIRSEALAACLYLSLAISFKQWAVMAAPLFVLSSLPGRRLRALLASVALPGVLVVGFLAVDFKHALPAFVAPVTQVLAFPGHPWVAATWLGPHSSQVNRALATLLAAGLAWTRRARAADAQQVVGTVALILLIRPLTETINYSYYWSPGLVLLAVLGMSGARRVRTSDWLWPVLAMAWTLPHSNDLTALDWWGGEAVLLAVMLWRLARPLGLARPGGTVPAPPGRPQLAEAAR